jgi:hypothetical protein
MEGEKHVVLQWLDKAAASLLRIFAAEKAHAAKPPTTSELALQWLELDRTRTGFGRQAKALKKQQDRIAKELTASIKEVPKRKFQDLGEGLLLQLVRKQAQVKWMEEYTAAKGVQAAEQLRKAAPWGEVLVVTSSTDEETAEDEE